MNNISSCTNQFIDKSQNISTNIRTKFTLGNSCKKKKKNTTDATLLASVPLYMPRSDEVKLFDYFLIQDLQVVLNSSQHAQNVHSLQKYLLIPACLGKRPCLQSISFLLFS